MKASLLAMSTFMIMFGTTAAMAASGCSGDFRSVDGVWVSDPECQRNVAESVAASEHFRITRHADGVGSITPEQFCRGNENIDTDVYCAPYKD